jgi:hypothetical protein
MSLVSLATLKRLAFRLLVIVAFAVLWPGPALPIATAALCILLATLVAAFAHGESLAGPSLNRWHESVVLFAIGCLIVSQYFR